MPALTPIELSEIHRTAIQARLADPSRRSLLLAWLPHALTASLPRMGDPASQLRSDLYELLQFETQHRQPALSIWLENAERLTEIHPGVPAVFAAARRRLTESAFAAEPPTPGVASPSPPADPAPADALRPLERIQILLMATQVRGTARLETGEELTRIEDVLRGGLLRDRFEVAHCHASETFAIQQRLLESDAHVLHFSGHGVAGGRLVLKGRSGEAIEVAPDGIRALIELAQESAADFRIALFNACHSADLAEVLVRAPAVVRCAIGTSRAIDDDVAIEFSRGFYNALASGKDVNFAFRAGTAAVGLLGARLEAQKSAFHIFLADGTDPVTLLLR